MRKRTGLAIVGGVAVLFAGAVLQLFDGPWYDHTEIRVDIKGGAIAREGGTLEVVTGPSDMRLNCAGVCDDLVLEYEGLTGETVSTRVSASPEQAPGRVRTYVLEHGRVDINGATAEPERGWLGRISDRVYGKFPEMPARRRDGYTRVYADGGAVSRAGGAVVSLKADTLSYSQRCVGACDTLLIDFPSFRDGVYTIKVSARDGRSVFDGGAYVDGHMSSRLLAGPDGRLRLDTKLVGY